MEIAVLGLSHKTAPLELREKLSVSSGQSLALLEAFEKKNIFHERVLVSTCNRTEIYGACDNFEESMKLAQQCLGEYACLDPRILDDKLYMLRQPDSIKHLFSVTSGLDSMVLGETEILGQVKDAYLSAHKSSHTGKVLNTLFQRSLKVAKNVRTHTEIGSGKVSVASVAVNLSEKIFTDLKGVHAMVLGTGEMATQIIKALSSRGARITVVSSSQHGRAEGLAEDMGVSAVSYEAYEALMEDVDIFIASTTSSQALIHEKQVRRWIKLRHEKPLFLIDIALPRNIEASAEKIDNVYLYNIDDLKAIADKNKAFRENELDKCLALVSAQTNYFMSWFNKEFGSPRIAS